MRVKVKVITRAKQEAVERKDDLYIVRVKAIPIDGKANEEMIKLLAKYFGVAKSNVDIIRGATSRTKVISIN